MIAVFYLLFLGIFPLLSQCSNEWNAQDYAQNSQTQLTATMNELHKLGIQPTDTVLDIGCGDGKITHYLANSVVPAGTVVGIDQSINMVNVANKSYQSANLSFKSVDVMNMDFDRQFDKAVSFWVFHWVTDLAVAFKKLHNALKPGGKALICCMVERGTLMTDCIEQVMALPEWQPYCAGKKIPLYPVPLENFIKVVKESKFKIDYLELKQIADHFKNKEELQAMYGSIVPLVAAVPERLRPLFLNQAFSLYYSAITFNSDGSFDDIASPSIIIIVEKI